MLGEGESLSLVVATRDPSRCQWIAPHCTCSAKILVKLNGLQNKRHEREKVDGAGMREDQSNQTAIYACIKMPD